MKNAGIIAVTIAIVVIAILLPSTCGCGGGLGAALGGDLDFPEPYRWTHPVSFGFPQPQSATDIRSTSIAAEPVRDMGKFRNAFAHWEDGAGDDCPSQGVCAPRLVVDEKANLGAGEHADIDVVQQGQEDLTRAVTQEKATPGTLLMGEDGKLTRAVSGDTAKPRVVVIEEWQKTESGRAVGGLYATCTVYLPDDRTNYLGRAVIRVRSDVTGDLLTGVADHEAGHALGLMHSKRFEDAMFSVVYGVKARVFGLTANDRRRIRELYTPLATP